MKGSLLVLDAHYLCHRAFHVSGHLEWEGNMTGVIFGFLKSIAVFKDEFHTDLIAFCFDGADLDRKRTYPNYKQKRNKDRDPQEQAAYSDLGVQIRKLREEYLPKIGFKNVFYHPKYESDDLMASLARSYEGDVILVTADSDMYQCLRPTVSIYSPQKMRMFTHDWFWKEYKMPPSKWAVVKAISGCHTDNVSGVFGVGEKTAIKYVRGELSSLSKAWRSIMSSEGKERVRRNRILVELPYPNCPAPVIQPDAISKKAWREVCASLGMRSIANRPPVSSRRVLV